MIEIQAYLTDFFEITDFPNEAREAYFAVYGQINADAAAAARFAALLAAYDADMGFDLAAAIEETTAICEAVGVHSFTGHGLLFACLSRRLRFRYREQGIDDGIWKNTMLDLKYKAVECRLVQGVWGTFVAKWNEGFFNMTRFALGRLQFELKPFGHEYTKNGVVLTPDSPVINTHIPRSEQPLTRESVQAAYALAAEFFKERLQGAPVAFYCSSWLLFDRHHEMLKPESNIRRFVEDFDIVETGEYKDYGEVWRLFDKRYTGDPDGMPVDTSLRRAYVALMKRGEKTGFGKGVFLYQV